MPRKNIKVAVVIDEYFGAAGTAIGGFGHLARHIICKYLPSESFHFDVLLRRKKRLWSFLPTRYIIDGNAVIRPPSLPWLWAWLWLRNYDAYITIEFTHDVTHHDLRPWKRIVHYIRDPRPWYAWRQIRAMRWCEEPCYFNPRLNNMVTRAERRGQVRFISQAESLDAYARDLYSLFDDVSIECVPNPVPLDESFDLDNYPKENLVVFLGRLESQKRAWLFCEVARAMPQYQFAVIGRFHRHVAMNKAALEPYMDGKVPNLKFVGHLEGDAKYEYLKRAKILLNTSIWEGIPQSFLEALSVGTLLVSNLNPDNLTARFGAYIGEAPGDGFDKVGAFAAAIDGLLSDEARRRALAHAAREHVRTRHSVEAFRASMHQLLQQEAAKGAENKRKILSAAIARLRPARSAR
jgi:glycosyltransferase involved in cell wall biosynthesis